MHFGSKPVSVGLSSDNKAGCQQLQAFQLTGSQKGMDESDSCLLEKALRIPVRLAAEGSREAVGFLDSQNTGHMVERQALSFLKLLFLED